jgi:hypothetical protein
MDSTVLMSLKSISERFEILLCHKNLTWNQHKEVASIKKVVANPTHPCRAVPWGIVWFCLHQRLHGD